MNGHAAVLLLGLGAIKDMSNDWVLPELLKIAPHNIYMSGMSFTTLDASFNDMQDPNNPHDPLKALRPFNAVVVCGFPHLEPDANGTDDLVIRPDRLTLLTQYLIEYVKLGGGLYIYGHSLNEAGSRGTNTTLNAFLKELAQEPREALPPTEERHVELLFEELREDPNSVLLRKQFNPEEWRNESYLCPCGQYRRGRYPGSSCHLRDVSHFWYPVGGRDSPTRAQSVRYTVQHAGVNQQQPSPGGFSFESFTCR